MVQVILVQNLGQGPGHEKMHGCMDTVHGNFDGLWKCYAWSTAFSLILFLKLTNYGTYNTQYVYCNQI